MDDETPTYADIDALSERISELEDRLERALSVLEGHTHEVYIDTNDGFVTTGSPE